MTMFTEAEKSIREVLQSESGGDSTDEYSFTEVTYAASGMIIRDRLEVMGFTLPATRAVFEDGIHRQLLDAQETLRSREADIIAHVGNEEMRVVYERMAEGAAEEIRMLGLLSFDAWLDGFRSVNGKELNRWDLILKKDDSAVLDLPPLERFMLSSDGFAYRFPPCDLRFLIRAVVQACGFNSKFQLDMSDVVSSGYYDIADRVAEDARVELTSDYPVNTKVIVLTEGMTDRRVLEDSLRLLYPHLSDYYSFMDFEGANAPGGAGQLVNTVKAFAGAGIANRVVALFDNDTAARVALRGLGGVSLPSSTPISIKAEFISYYKGKCLNFEIGDGLSIHFLPTSPLVGFAAYQEGAYADYHPPDYYPSLEIRYGKGVKKKASEEEGQLFESFMFELAADADVVFSAANLKYDFDENPFEELEGKDFSTTLRPLEPFTEGMRLYLAASQITEPGLKLLSFYKVLEYFAPIVMALDSNEAMRKKLDSPSTLKPDANFLKSIFELARSLEQRRKDKEMIRLVLETCMDFVDVASLLPKPLAKELSHDDKKGQSEHIRFVSEALVATRNQVAHAKSNYEPQGNEVSEEYLPQLNEFVQAAAVRTIRWFNRLPVHLKLKF